MNAPQASARSALTIDIVDTDDGFASLAAEWSDLLGRSPSGNPFRSFEWLYPWWSGYGGSDDELRIVRARDAASGQLAGVLPLYASRSSATMRLRLLGDANAGSTGLGPVIDRDAQEDVLAALTGFLEGSRGDWDVLDLRCLDVGDPFLARVVRDLGGPGTVVRREVSFVCPTMALPATWDEYLGTFSSRGRRRFLANRRKVAALGGGEVEFIERPEDVPDAVA